MALYKGDVMLAGVSNGFNPASAGTTGQILTKTASGYDWDDAPDSANTKTFYLSAIGDLTTAQAIYDYLSSGKMPIVRYGDAIYTLGTVSSTRVVFYGQVSTTNSTNVSKASHYRVNLILVISNSTVTNYGISQDNLGDFLDTNTNYSTPYTPTYPGSPATKKYVDDNAGMKLAPNSPLSPKYHWFGTEAQYQALSKYYTDVENDTVYYTI